MISLQGEVAKLTNRLHSQEPPQEMVNQIVSYEQSLLQASQQIQQSQSQLQEQEHAIG